MVVFVAVTAIVAMTIAAIYGIYTIGKITRN